MLAFVPTVALPRGRAPSTFAPWVCAAGSPAEKKDAAWRVAPKRPAPARIAGAVLSTVALALVQFGRVPRAHAETKTPTPVPAKQLRYDGRQELDGGEKAMSLTLTAGTFAGLLVWAWKKNRKDDELENVRIKEEVERLDKLKAEFIDVEEDEETMDDEDLLASLKQRIGDTEDGDEDDEEGGEGAVSVAEGEEGSDETEGQQAEGDADVATSDSLDMLKRMWEATDGDDDAKKDKS